MNLIPRNVEYLPISSINLISRVNFEIAGPLEKTQEPRNQTCSLKPGKNHTSSLQDGYASMLPIRDKPPQKEHVMSAFRRIGTGFLYKIVI